jgi:hemolysin III
MKNRVVQFGERWLILLALDPLLAALPRAGFIRLLTGAILYTSGIVSFALDRRCPWMHGVWHLPGPELKNEQPGR